MNIKKLITIWCILSSSLAGAQSWIWAKEPISVGSMYADPIGADRYAACDKVGNTYIVGWYGFASSGPGELIFGSDTLTTNIGERNMYLAKYDSSGLVLWAKQSTGTSSNVYSGTAISLDNNANIYVSGTVDAGITYFGPYPIRSHLMDMFLVKYDQNGNILWAKQDFASDTTSIISGMTLPTSNATDKWGNIYVTGYFFDTVLFDSDTLAAPHESCTFLAKYNSNGTLVWAKQSIVPSSASFSEAHSVATDASGNVYITGRFKDTIEFGGYMLTNPGIDMFIVKYDSVGNILWANQSVTLANANIQGQSVTTDYPGGVYVTGSFQKSVVLGGDTLMNSTGSSIYLAKYSNSGGLLWAEQNNSTDPNPWEGYTLVADTLKRGGCYMLAAVIFDSEAFFELRFGGNTFKDSLTANPFADYSATALLQIDSTGKVICGSIFSEGGDDDGSSVAVNPSSKYVCISGDILGHVKIGNDSLIAPSEIPFIARWQNCCGAMNPNLSIVSDTCNKPDGMAIAHVTGDNGPFTYSWSPSGGTDSVASSLSAGVYGLSIKDADGCTKTATVNINNYTVPISVLACCDSVINKSGAAVHLSVGNANSYLWSPSNSLSCDTCQNTIATPSVSTEYYITVSNKDGCSSRDSVFIKVECGEIFIPNAFSPNGDNTNDVLYVYGGCIEALDFKIYDRWGNMVFETTDPAKGWNGKYNGQDMDSGIYDYTLVALQSNGNATDLKGNITLIR
jgi:gliding motility-associated-like protein